MYHEQQLVLLGLEAMVFRLQFAEVNETSDLSAELSQITVFLNRKSAACIHKYIVSRCIKHLQKAYTLVSGYVR